MRNEREQMMKQIHRIDFAIHELVLFLDTHPRNVKALQLLEEYRNLRCVKIAEYERRFGNYVAVVDDVKPTEPWGWVKGPWPWENKFMMED